MTALRSAIRRLLDSDDDLQPYTVHRLERVDGHLVEVDTFDVPRYRT